ncbi:MAG: site-specific DNA-methyltransferase [Chloroflexi bacterium]|nr:site-specific DNA-methyltransferase [Chloroflexota bacterium]
MRTRWEQIPSPLVGEGKGEGDKTLLLRFQYRELTSAEVTGYGVEGGSNTLKQDRINQKSYGQALSAVADARLKSALATPRAPTGKADAGAEDRKPLLLYRISRFTNKNTRDYFVHRDLKGFLSEQLDYFIKAEVIDIETLEKESVSGGIGRHLTRARVVREVGEDVIAFLSQIEDFQKRLWEKKKFVLKTEYVITTDRLPEELVGEVWVNEGQKKEWQELGFGIPGAEVELKTRKYPVDTRYFPLAFKETLLEKLTENRDLDDLLDGLLIKSENWQALNLLTEKYRGKVRCIYIDPPYNTGDSEILYKNSYLFSSWLTLMENRLATSLGMLSDDPIVFIAIDDFEMVDLCQLIDKNFPFLRREMIVVNHHPQGGKAKTLATTHEYMLACVAASSDRTLTGRVTQDGVELRPFKRSGTAESNFRHGRPNSFYALLVDQAKVEVVGTEPPPNIDAKYPTERTQGGLLRVYPLGSSGEERVWRRSYESCLPLIRDKKLRCSDNMTIYQVIEAKDRTPALFSNWVGPRYNAGTFGANLLGDIMGEHNPFSYPKSIHTVEDAIFAGTEDNAICLDYFAGSGTTGHAVINLNRDYGTTRKYILVEMGDWFETVLLPRLEKAIFCEKWKEGKPAGGGGVSHMLKYHLLEQYEDTLDNIEVTPNQQAEMTLGDDYLLKYFLDYETRGNSSLLNVENLKDPFSYRLRVNVEEVGESQEMAVDIPETFNYLLGLKVKKIKAREIASGRKAGPRNDEKNKYLFILGEKEGKDVAIVWRQYDDGWDEADFKRDKQFIIDELEPWSPHVVYVNGQSVLTPQLGAHAVEIRQIEPEFKRLMG